MGPPYSGHYIGLYGGNIGVLYTGKKMETTIYRLGFGFGVWGLCVEHLGSGVWGVAVELSG